MAYALSQRFPTPSTYYRILDPGAYQNTASSVTQKHKAPFLSNAPRHTQFRTKLWTHAIYNTDIPTNIINCTSLKSKLARFPYDAMTKEDFEKLLCQCGIQSTCECSTNENHEEEIACQGKISRRIFKGHPPRFISGESLTTSFEKRTIDTQPPFYDARVLESTSFYKGWKWSQWTSKRSNVLVSSGPGPGNYTIERQPNYETLCAEKVRAHKRKTSKQLRFIEIVQQRNKRERLPGPGAYSRKQLKGTNLTYLGPKAERFKTSTYDVRPGPADHWVKRDFDPPEFFDKICHAQLPKQAPFGSKAVRLKPRYEEGPSPASYDSKLGTCEFVRCSKAPFGVSSIRFKDSIEEEDDIIDEVQDGESKSKNECDIKPCLLPTWEFRSQTIRMKPLCQKFNEPSPADLPQRNIKITRSRQLQCVAPFFTSNERFRPWFNWIPVYGAVKTPGPGYYSLEAPKCLPAVRSGPLFRSVRFKPVTSHTPSPNEYNVGGGLENVLVTHNERLKRNMKIKHNIYWKPGDKTRNLSPSEKERILFQRSLELLQEMENNKQLFE